MSQIIEVKVPDIGDFHDVPVIELLVEPGATVQAEDPLLTLESDKATIDVPSPVGGVLKEFTVKVGDKISEGSLIARIEGAATADAAAPAEKAAPAAAPAPQAATPAATASVPTTSPAPAPAPIAADVYTGAVDIECEMLVLGAGPGGYSAAFRSADLGMKTVLVERYATLGGVCLNVGCIPSKALLHVTSLLDETAHLADCGVSFAAPKVDIDRLRAHKAGVVAKLTGGLAGMAKARKVSIVRGVGSFLDAHHLEVALTSGEGQTQTGEKKHIRFQKCIIAAGSTPVHLPFLPNDPRIVDSTGALELRALPKKMLVIGGGIIGLEMATVYSTLGAKIDVVEMLDALMQGPDRDAVKVWEKRNAHRFERIMLKTKTVAVEAKDDGLWVKFEGEQAPAEAVRYDMILQSAGRTPNGKKIAAEKAGITVNERGFIPVDAQMRTNVPHIFAIGDIVGNPMLAHKAVHEAHVAAEVASGRPSGFERHPRRGLHPSGSCLGRPHAGSGQAGRAQDRHRRFPLGGIRARHCQRRRLRFYQAGVRR